MLNEIIDLIGDRDAHFVLAVGSNNDWIAFIEQDERPDELLCWGVSDKPEEAINFMLANGLTRAA